MLNPNSLAVWLREMTVESFSEIGNVDEAQILPDGRLSILLEDGTIVRVKMEVEVSPPSQEAKTEIM